MSRVPVIDLRWVQKRRRGDELMLAWAAEDAAGRLDLTEDERQVAR